MKWKNIKTAPREKWIIVWDTEYNHAACVWLTLKHSLRGLSHWLDYTPPTEENK